MNRRSIKVFLICLFLSTYSVGSIAGPTKQKPPKMSQVSYYLAVVADFFNFNEIE
jgi:hypothetical protein